VVSDNSKKARRWADELVRIGGILFFLVGALGFIVLLGFAAAVGSMAGPASFDDPNERLSIGAIFTFFFCGAMALAIGRKPWLTWLAVLLCYVSLATAAISITRYRLHAESVEKRGSLAKTSSDVVKILILWLSPWHACLFTLLYVSGVPKNTSNSPL
jgi:hypothetical protein